MTSDELFEVFRNACPVGANCRGGMYCEKHVREFFAAAMADARAEALEEAARIVSATCFMSNASGQITEDAARELCRRIQSLASTPAAPDSGEGR